MIHGNGHLSIAKRENNTKRGFLLVNHRQAKHIPTPPQTALEYFAELAGKIPNPHKNTIIIGFAETATAIGAQVAATLGNAHYFQTTREKVNTASCIVEFLEEHCHAVEQALYSCITRDVWLNASQIVLVDDEITTGKTALNLAEKLRENGFLLSDTPVLVAALVDASKNNNISLENLEHLNYNFPEEFNPDVIIPKTALYPNITRLNGYLNPRVGVDASEYKSVCEKFALAVNSTFDVSGKSVLIVGTEEFMYPPLIVGVELCNTAKSVHVQATTRSPVLTSGIDAYPLKSRFVLRSLYDSLRTTYLYNLKKYDTVLIMTDSTQFSEGLSDLHDALAYVGNDSIYTIVWEK